MKDKFALSGMINLLHTQKFYYFVRGRREETKSVADGPHGLSVELRKRIVILRETSLANV